MKICFLSDHHLSYNPRLWKEAFFYEKLGYEVVIKVMWISESALTRDRDLLEGHNIRYEPYLNLIPGIQSAWIIFLTRLRKRLFVELQRFTGISKQWTISYAPEKMYYAALSENADYYSAHMECAFYVGAKLIRSGKKVIFDFEDWYSRDYLTPERPVKLLSEVESFALNKGLFCTAASQSMKDGLLAAYECNKEVEVIYNSFPNEQILTAGTQSSSFIPRFLWFSRNIGSGRGLEKFVKALHNLSQPVELHLLGEMTPGFRETIGDLFPNKLHSLHFHDFLPHNQLQDFISGFDIGLAIEENINDNKDLTVSNKILMYLQAGIKVFATDTKGHEEVAKNFPGSIVVVNNDYPDLWAKSLSQLIKAEVDAVETLHVFDSLFSWQSQENKLKDLAKKYL